MSNEESKSEKGPFYFFMSTLIIGVIMSLYFIVGVSIDEYAKKHFPPPAGTITSSSYEMVMVHGEIDIPTLETAWSIKVNADQAGIENKADYFLQSKSSILISDQVIEELDANPQVERISTSLAEKTLFIYSFKTNEGSIAGQLRKRHTPIDKVRNGTSNPTLG